MIEQLLIGTYTKKTSKGIHKAILDIGQEETTNVELATPSQEPVYLQVGRDSRIYTIEQIDDKGGVASHSLSDDSAKMLSDILAAGAPPAYVGVDNKRHLLFSANYHTAKIDVFKINEDGALTQTDPVLHEGVTDPEPEQETPHVHHADLTPDNRLAVCDLGMDLVVVYGASDDGKLIAASRYKCEDGFGIRHIVFHPDGNYAYLSDELSSKLEALKYNSKDASFKHPRAPKTIPEDWTAHNRTVAIRILNDGKFVYTSNRDGNTIAVFGVQPNFTVKHIRSVSTEGDFPCDFNLNQDENYLLAPNQNPDNLILYRRNSSTGKLTLLQKDASCPEPVCVTKWK